MELLLVRRCRILKRVPKASRIPAAQKVADILRQVVVDPDWTLPSMHCGRDSEIWDAPFVSQKYEEVLSAAQNQAGRTWLIVVAAPHSGDFLNAIPCSSVGMKLDGHLAAPRCRNVCTTHVYLSSAGRQLWCMWQPCRKSARRHMWHNAVNDFIKRALTSANVPSVLQPNSLSRDDGKRPGGLTVLPCANGRCMVWDLTCPDTLANSHVNRSSYLPALQRTRLEVKKLLTIADYRLYTASCQYR